MADSEIHLTRLDGSDVSFHMSGGTVPARDLKAVTDPPIGTPPTTQAELDAPVTMILEGGAVPAVGQDVVVFLAYNQQTKTWDGALPIVITQTPSGPTYAFTSEPRMDTWKVPSSEVEMKLLIAAVHSS